MTAEEYRKYLEQDFSDVNIDEMTDLLTVKADRNKSLKERRESYLNKVGNPYLVRIGNMKVKVRFANNGISLEQAFENMLRRGIRGCPAGGTSLSSAPGGCK